MTESQVQESAEEAPAKTGRLRVAREGVVVSSKMDKSVVVSVERTVFHELYGRAMKRSTKYMAHDELGCGKGDRVRIEECRPLSKRKRWVVKEIVRQGAESRARGAKS